MVKFIPGNATVIAENVSTSMSDKSDKTKKAKKAINPQKLMPEPRIISTHLIMSQ